MTDRTFLGQIIKGDINVLPGESVPEHGSGNLFVNDSLQVLGTASSTAHNNGALTVAGGAGVSGNLNVKQNLAVTGTSSFLDDATFGPNASVVIQGTSSSSGPGTGQLVVAGGAGIGAQLNVGDTLTVQSTSESTSKVTGAATIAGGLGVSGQVNTSGLSVINDGDATIQLLYNQDFSGTDSGSILFVSGEATAGTIQVSDSHNGRMDINGATSKNVTVALGGGNIGLGGAEGTEKVVVRGDILVTSTLDSTSTTSGALKVAGGIGIAKSVTAGSFVTVNSAAPGGIVRIVNPSSNANELSMAYYRNADMSTTVAGDHWAHGTNAWEAGDRVWAVGASGTGAIVSLTPAGAAAFNVGPVTVANTTASTSSTSAALAVSGGIAVGATTDASSVSNGGALTVAGGLAVGAKSFLGGIVTVTSTAQATSSQTGALVVAGGLGVAGDVITDTAVHIRRSGSLGGVSHTSMESSTGLRRFTTGLVSEETGLGNTGSNYAMWRYDDTGALVEKVYGVNRATGLFELTRELKVLSTTESTSTTTGAIVLGGGIGVGGNASVGGDLTVGGNIDATGGSVTFSSTTNSTSPTTGSVVVSGGIGVAKDVNVGGNLTVTGQLSATGGIAFDSTADSTSVTTGALVLRGGLGVAKSMYLGGTLHLVNTTESISSSTGSLIVSGGIGIAGAVHTGGQLTVHSTLDSTSPSTGSAVIEGGLGVAADTFVGGILDVTGRTATDALVTRAGGLGAVHQSFTVGSSPRWRYVVDGTEGTNSGSDLYLQSRSDDNSSSIGYIKFGRADASMVLSSTTDSTTIGSGALVVGGGSSFGGNVNVQKGLKVYSTTDASSTTSGALVVAGGAGISGKLYAGSYMEYGASTQRYAFSTSDATGSQHYNVSATSSTRFNFGHGSESANYPTNMYLYSLGRAGTTNQEGLCLVASGSEHSIQSFATGGGSNRTIRVGPQTLFQTDGTILAQNTVDSSTVSSGALVVSGGVGIAKQVHIGGATSISDVTASTTPTTGALIVSGGTGIQGRLNVAGDATFQSNVILGTGTGDYQSLKLGGGTAYGRLLGAFNQLSDGVHLTYNADNDNVAWFIDDTDKATSRISVRHGTVSVYTGDVNSPPTTEHFRVSQGTGTQFLTSVSLTTVTLLDTTDSSSPSTGALVVPGGLGVGKSVNVGGTVHVVNATESSSLTTGALVVDGGAAIAAKLNVGSSVSTWNGTSLAGTAHLVLKSTSGQSRFQFGLSGMEDTDNVGSNLQLWRAADNGVVIDSVLKIVRATGQVMFQQTAQSTTSTTGSIVIAGGVGIAGNLNTGGSAGIGTSMSVATTLTVGGVAAFNDTTESLSTSTGSVVVAGGAGIAKSINVGGNATIAGSTAIGGNVSVMGSAVVADTTESTSVANGAVVISGGVGIAKSLNVGGGLVVGGNTVLNGNLIVNGGSITEIKTQTLDVADNVILLNAGPNSSADAGIGFKRYQPANDNGNGDVVQHDAADATGTARTGSTSTTIVLDTAASSVNDFYKNCWIKITSGTGANQVRKIKAYNGATKVATLYSTADQVAKGYMPVEGMDWTTVPDVTSRYSLYDTQYIISFFEESDQTYVFGSSPDNPASSPFVSVRDTINIRCKNLSSTGLIATDTINEYSANAGVTVEGVNIKDGALTGVTSINGNTVDQTVTVSVTDNTTSRAAIPGTGTYGTYMILVRSTNNAGASAVFAITARSGVAGYVNRMSSVRGTNGENIDIEWNANQQPVLRHLLPISGASGAALQYVVKVLAV